MYYSTILLHGQGIVSWSKMRHFEIEEALESFDKVSQTAFQPLFKVLKTDVLRLINRKYCG